MTEIDELKPDTPIDAVSVTEETPDAEQPNAVLVVKIQDEDGSISTDVIPTGNVQATEVQTLIELGLVAWRQKIGLSA